MKKRYNVENTSKKEIEVIKKRIDHYDKDVILMREMPIPSIFVQKLFFEKLTEIIKPESQFFLLIDLREVLEKPDSELREILKNLFNHYRKQLIHCFVVVDSKMNVLLKFTAGIIMNKSVNSYSIHSDFDEALGRISSYLKVKNK